MNVNDPIFDEFLNGKNPEEFDTSSMSESEKQALKELYLVKDAADAYNYNILKKKMHVDIKAINKIRSIYLYAILSFLLIAVGTTVLLFTIKKSNPVENNNTISDTNTIIESDTISNNPVWETDSSKKSDKLKPVILENRNKSTQKQDTIIGLLDNDNLRDSIVKKSEMIDSQFIYKTSITNTTVAKDITCMDIKEQTATQIFATCENEENGEIIIPSVPTINFIYNNATFESVNLENLASGYYLIESIEDNGCRDSMRLFVPTKKCIGFHKYNLNPVYDNPIPFSCKNACRFELKDKAGNTLMIQYINAGEVFEFIGKENLVGTYIYTITEKNNQVEYGQITIVR